MKFRPILRGARIVGLATLWLLVLLLACEAYARFQFYRTSRHNALVVDELGRRAHFMLGFDQSLWERPFWEYKKNVEVKAEYRGRECRIRINNRGYRGADFQVPKPPHRYRILCVGGSTTVEGWTDEATYPALLEQRLNEYFEADSFEVINCGISALGSIGELRKLPDYLALEPDLIIEYNWVNDVFQMVPMMINAGPTWQKVVRKSRLLTRALNDWVIPSADRVARGMERRTFANLTAFHENAAAQNVEVVFCTFAVIDPSKMTKAERNYLEYGLEQDWGGNFVKLKNYCAWTWLYNERLERMCREKGYSLIPVAEGIPGSMEYFIDICHMTDRGIQTKADLIFDHLKDRFARPAQPRTEVHSPRG